MEIAVISLNFSAHKNLNQLLFGPFVVYTLAQENQSIAW